MAEILCSTGALIGRPNGRDYRLLSGLSEKLLCDGFEFMMYDSWYEEWENIAAYLRESGFYIPVVHCEKHIGEAVSRGDGETAAALFRTNCRLAEKIGAEKMVIHLWDGQYSDRTFENNRRAYPALLSVAKDYGLDLLVENVVCNCEDPMTHWCDLRECYPDVHFVFDTKMAAFHGQLELLYQKDYEFLWREGHIRHYHVNDYGGGFMEWEKLRTLPVGAGGIDFATFFDFVRRTGYDGTFTVEATAFRQDGTVDCNMLNACFREISHGIGIA